MMRRGRCIGSRTRRPASGYVLLAVMVLTIVVALLTSALVCHLGCMQDRNRYEMGRLNDLARGENAIQNITGS